MKSAADQVASVKLCSDLWLCLTLMIMQLENESQAQPDLLVRLLINDRLRVARPESSKGVPPTLPDI